jgi:hypothetical protein
LQYLSTKFSIRRVPRLRFEVGYRRIHLQFVLALVYPKAHLYFCGGRVDPLVGAAEPEPELTFVAVPTNDPPPSSTPQGSSPGGFETEPEMEQWRRRALALQAIMSSQNNQFERLMRKVEFRQIADSLTGPRNEQATSRSVGRGVG